MDWGEEGEGRMVLGSMEVSFVIVGRSCGGD